MKYITNAQDFLLDRPCSLTVGKFDGLHLGHDFLTRKVVTDAKEHRRLSAVVTFDMSPRLVLGADGEKELKNLITGEERRLLLSELGVDYLLELSFTEDLQNMTPEDFLSLLSKQFSMKHLVCGNDFTFGKYGAGDIALLESQKDVYGFTLDVVEKVKAHSVDISSTLIRRKICQGDLEEANALLGYAYFIYGEILHGNHIGSSISAPTINLLPPADKLLPPNGVYVTEVRMGDETYLGVTNIGIRPTITKKSNDLTVETHILHYNGDAYGEKVRVDFLKYLRPEQKFDDLEHLSVQIQKDIEAAEKYYKNITKYFIFH